MATEIIYAEDVEFEASYSLETQRIPDPWPYVVKYGKLYSPVTGEPAENSITRNNSIEESEYRAFRQIQGWAVEAEGGTAVWISRASRHDLSTKIVLSEIAYTLSEKQLFNRGVCLDMDDAGCLSFAKRLGLATDITAEELVANPVFPRLTMPELVAIVSEYVPRQAELIVKGEDLVIKENLKAAIALGRPAPMGPYNSSCGPGANSAFNAMYSNSQHSENWSYHSGICRVCGESTSVGPCNICKVCEKRF